MRKELGLAILILVIGCVVAVLQPRFISAVNLLNMANLVGLYGLFSIGQGLVIITGGIELSVGSVFALIGVVFVDMVVNWGWSWPLALAAAIAMGGVFGAIHGYLVARVGIQPFVVTLCALLIYRGAARYYTDDATVGFGYGGDFDPLADFANGQSFGIPNSFLVMVLVALVMWVVLHRSVFGRYLFAVGKNEEAARYSGISTRAVIASAYIICGLLAGLAAVFLAFYTNSIQPSAHGNFYELYAIAAAVLGGCSLRGGEGSILGIILGTVLLQVLQNLVNLLGIPSSLNFAVMGTVILIGVLADQHLQRLRTARQARAVPAGAERPAQAIAGSSPKP